MHGQNALVLQSNIKTCVSTDGDWSSMSLADWCQLHACGSWRVMHHMADVWLTWTFAVNQHADDWSGPEPAWTYRTRNHHNWSVCEVLRFVLWHLLISVAFGFFLRVVACAVKVPFGCSGVILILHSGFFWVLLSLAVFAFTALFVSTAGVSAPRALLLLLTFDPWPTGDVAAGTRELADEVFHASRSRQIGSRKLCRRLIGRPFSVLVLRGDARVSVWRALALWDTRCTFVVCSLETHHSVLKHTWVLNASWPLALLLLRNKLVCVVKSFHF